MARNSKARWRWSPAGTAASAWRPPSGSSAEGANVVITGRRQAELDAAVKEIGQERDGVQGDVSKLADLDRLYATVKEKHGRVDVLFANAGGGEFAPLGQITEAHFDKRFGINVKGLLFTVQKALPLMPRRRVDHPERVDRRRSRGCRRSASTARPRRRCGRSPARGRST